MRVAFEIDYSGAGSRGPTHSVCHLFRLLPGLAPEDDFLLFGWWLREHERKAEQFKEAVSERVRLAVQRWPQSIANRLEWQLGLPIVEHRLRSLGVDLYDCTRAPVTSYGRLVVRGLDATQVTRPQWHVPQSLRAWEQIYLPSLKKADKVICYCRYQARDLVEAAGVDEKKIALTYPGVDHALFNPDIPPRRLEEVRSALRLPPRYLLMVGPFDDVQNFSAVLEALALWKASGSQLPPIAAVGPLDEYTLGLKHRAEAAGFGAQFHWLGYAKHADLAPVMRAAEGLIYPSTLPGVEMPPIETMATGTPVITSLDEVIEGEAGIQIDPRSPQDLYQAMRRVWETPSLRETLGRRGIQRSKDFTWDAFARGTLAVYRELAGR